MALPFFSLKPPSQSPHSTPLHKTNNKQLASLLTSLASSSSNDPTSTNQIIKKFISSSSKSTSLQVLSLLLSQSSPLSLPVYQRISRNHWFSWSPNLAAHLISVLDSNGDPDEARRLISESVSRLASKREVARFYCELIDAAAEKNSKGLVFECYGRIQEMGFVGKRVFESMVKGLSVMGLMDDAEKVFNEMGDLGFKPSGFDYRMMIQGYGRLGLFDDMRTFIGEMEDCGLGVDTVCANVVLSCYGDCGNLTEMVTWIRKMRVLGICFSVRTFNSVLNSCPSLVWMVRDLGTLPLSLDELLKNLNNDEALLVYELTSSSLLIKNLKWSGSEGELDLHGFHLASAYVIILQWMKLLRSRFIMQEEVVVVPLEISVVCGSGKHSVVRGKSPVKKLVSKLMLRLKSPMMIDRKNAGKFVAKGKAVRDWLCSPSEQK